MSSEPLLPSYSDEKPPIDVEAVAEKDDKMIIDDKEFDGLRVGQPTLKSRVQEQWSTTSSRKKALIGLLFVLAGVTTFMRLHQPHPRHDWHPHHSAKHGEEMEDLERWTPTDDHFVPKHVSFVVASLHDVPDLTI
jgi:hypothetical protein